MLFRSAGVAIYGVDTVLSLGMKGIKSLADKESTSVSQDVDTTADGETTQEDTTAENTTEAAE